MRSIPSWLDAATFRQDYLWFLIVAGWSFAVLFWWRARPPGFALLAAAAIANATAEIASMLVLAVSSPEAAIPAEGVLGFVACLGPAAMFAAAMSGSEWRRYRWPAVGLLFLALGVLTWRRTDHPLAATGWQNGVAAAAGWWAAWRLRRSDGRGAKSQLWYWTGVVVALSPALGSSGVLAEIVLWPRRWLNASPLGVLAALVQGLILILACQNCRVLSRSARRPVGSGSARVGFGLLAGWLALGGLLAEIAGRREYAEFVASLRMRAATCLSTLDRSALAECLGPDFKLGPVSAISLAVWQAFVAPAPATAGPAFLPHQRRLEQLRRDNPDFGWIQIQTLRRGWLVDAVLPFTDARRNGKVSVIRPAESRDWERWASRAGFVEGPAWSPRGTYLTVAEPLMAPNGRMLGWLSIDVESPIVLQAQAPARLLMCLTVAMGAALGGGLIVLRARNQAHREAEAEAAAALAADRMKSALLAHVSHELRTPLQGILGYAELIEERLNDPQLRGWLLSQRKQGELLLRLVNDLIDLGALENGVFRLIVRPAQLAAVIEESVSSLRPKAHLKGLRLELEVDASVPAWLSFDTDRVRQVVLNLLGNAIKFTEQGGVLVAVKRIQAPDDGAAAEAVIEIAVADTGPGIRPEDQAGLFKPFSRLAGTLDQEGAGLGLALTRGLCGAMGGGVTLESDGRTGSTFRATVRLRRVEPSKADEPARGNSSSLQHLRIVVADDNSLVRELYMAHLSAQGASCVSAADGRAAIAAVEREPRPDVLLLDLAMPHVDGMAVARHLRAGSATTPRIIGVSAHGNPEYRERALAAGMDEFLVKPVRLEALVRCLLQRENDRDGPRSRPGLPPGLDAKMHALFRAQAPAILAELDDALARGDWATLRSRAHYLKNSAWVLGQERLALLCDAVFEMAQRREGSAVLKQLLAIHTLVDGLLQAR